MLTYKGYVGHVEYDPDADILYGRVVDVRDTVTFKGKTTEEIKQAFKDSVDDYLEFCAEIGKTPSKPYSGNLSLRTTPELHRRIVIAAGKAHKSANEYMEELLDNATKQELVS